MWPLVDLIYRDYAAWKIENHGIFEQFKENNNSIYQRLEAVLLVLDHIYELACSDVELDEDYTTIFEVGFRYLSSQFDVIKVYFQSLFQSNCDDFFEYSDALLYLIYIFDIKNDIENHGAEVDLTALDMIEEDIENLIMERSDDFLVVEAKLKKTLDDVFESLPYEYVSIIDIFEDIADRLGIRFIDEDDFVIGSDM